MSEQEQGPGVTFASTEEMRRVEDMGFETRWHRAKAEAALFGEATTSMEIGPYSVIGTLGSGGMGVVYAAHDTRLDRRVALKLLRHANAGENARARLQREAQAMARLSHPNVVTVHEVGTHEGQVYLAMEFVGGSNLRAWLKVGKPSWREIVAVFIQAGEGLAAAHDAGIIHRDFKPDNVLVGDDGRIRVADFGLAHGLEGEPTQTDSEPSPEGSSASAMALSTPLTETGVILGTPVYMSPEQHNRGPIGTRSDQFSFCVALWEALYDQRPFPAKSFPELVAAVTTGELAEPEKPGEVPPWLREVVERGLAVNPEDRWPSMRALLAALARDPERVRKRRLRLLATAAVVVASLAFLSARVIKESRASAHQRHVNMLTEGLLATERERGLLQATDDARRARNATLMSSYRRYRPREGIVDHEDPTTAALLLREVEGEERESEAWISAANEILGQPLSYAVLSGHRDFIVDVAFAPDASALYSTANDGEVRRWDLDTGAGRSIIQHQGQVVSVAPSPDGRWVLTGAKDRTARLWSREAPEQPARVFEHDDELTMVAFDPGSAQAATSSMDGTVRVLELETGESRVLGRHGGPVYSLAFDDDGRRLLTGSRDRSARLWRVSDGARLASFSGHGDAVYHVRFVDDHRVVTGSDDGKLRMWEIDAPETPTVLAHHSSPITSIDVDGERVLSSAVDGSVRVVDLGRRNSVIALEVGSDVWSTRLVPGREQLITASFDGKARLWHTQDGSLDRVFRGHGQPALRVAVDRGGRWFATGSYDGDVRLWRLDRPQLHESLDGHRDQVSTIAIREGEQRAVTASHDGTLRSWSLTSARELAMLRADAGAIYSLVVEPEGSRAIAGTRSGTIVVWDPERAEVERLTGHEGEIWDLDLDRKGERLVSASLSGTARVWDLDRGEQLFALLGHEGAITSVLFGPEDRRIFSAGDDGFVRVWSAEDGRAIARWPGHDSRIWALALSPDGSTLATASDDRTARLWPSDDPADAIVLRGHTQPVWSVTFDASGEHVATTSYDGQAKIWRVADGELLRTLSGHDETVWSARFVGSDAIITASEDNTLRIWPDVGEAIVLSGHRDAVTATALTDDGARLLSGSADGQLQLWHLEQLTGDANELHERLRRATTACLGQERRVRELGESPSEAAAAVAACEADYGRASR